jgi:asparagine synthase (glutamine-hydrolysing)
MCGFAGFIRFSADTHAEDLRAAVEGMSGTLRHRGPDDSGVWVEPSAGVALGFRRLAIIDLSEAGHQPFVSPDGRYVLVFNGEVYNHAELRARLTADCGDRLWRGHSDTETLLACIGAWGLETTLAHAVGMYAFALWDRAERCLRLVRDRFGEKPLYYGWTRDAFVFGSELDALRAYPGFDNAIDPDVVRLYLQYCCVPAPYSIYREVYKIEPGSVLTLPSSAVAEKPSEPPFAPARFGHGRIDRYWSVVDVAEHGVAHPIADEREAVDRLEAALATAVQLQCLADVPLGAFLSGGIDSSTIVALMQEQSRRPVRTFTIGFGEEGFDEAQCAKAVATHLRTDHTELYVSAQQALDVIPRLPTLYSEPFADSSQIPTHLVSQMARQHVTVALSGDGGDELFGGYVRYTWGPRIWNSIGWLPAPVRRALANTIQRVPVPAWDTVARAIPLGVSRLGDKAHRLAHRMKGLDDIDALYEMLVTTWPPDAGVVPGAVRERTRRPAAGQQLDPEHRMMLNDALTYLPDDILQKVDRASMGVSLEARAPFLDHRVAELAWRLPLQMKIRDGRGKWIVRQLLHRRVPETLIERPKMGFGIPVGEWIRGPLRPWAEALLDERALRRDGYFDPAPIRAKWAQHLSGVRDWQSELWSVLMFQAWLTDAR